MGIQDFETGKGGEPATIASTLPLHRSPENSLANKAEDLTILTAMLAKLAQHYYRPDFTEGQARQLIRDYLHDLAEFDLRDVDAGVTAYRRDPKSKFFPTVGQLRERILEAQKDRLASARMGTAKARPQFGDSRPIMWWALPKNLWQPHWSESDVPFDMRVKDAPGGKWRWPHRRQA